VAQIRARILGLFLLAGVAGVVLPDLADAASCDALVGKWAWFIGGEVTVNPDGTFTQQSGNAGTWECTDARGRFTLRWRDGGFVNSLALSPDGQGLTSTDQSQWYVTAQRSASAPKPPQLVRKDNCCQENYGCETKRIEAEFTKKMAACHFPGNSGCISEATSWKASQLKAANENLRMCNRIASGGVTTPVPRAGGAAVPPASSDEFHSTEGSGDAGQMCQPCGFGADQTAGGDIFGSNSPGSDKDQSPTQPKPKPTPAGVRDESDCLPQIDAKEVERLKAERNDLLQSLAGAGYLTDLTLQTMGKLIAARLHHLTEPNEGIASRTARTARSAIEHAPETVVKAGEAVTKYLTNNNAANQRYLYGQVEIAVKKAQEEFKQKLRNPQITIATAADSLLVGKATGSLGTVCRQWTATKVAQLKRKIDDTRQAGKVVKQINDVDLPKIVCGTDRARREDCFWQALASATGDRSYFLRKKIAEREEIWDKLRTHFGGAKAKDPMTGRLGDLQQMAEGRPVPVTTDEFVKLLKDMPDKSEYMVFINRSGDDGHVATLAKLGGEHFLWDTQQRTSNMDKIFAGGQELFVYRYK